MKHILTTVAAAGLVLFVFLLCLPLIAIWFSFWMMVGSVRQPPDRLANRYYRLAVLPLLLPVCLLPDESPAEVGTASARGLALSDPDVAGAYA